MAGQAEALCFLEEKVRLIGAVGRMAGAAAVRLYDPVNGFLLEAVLLMALIAFLFPFGFQEVLSLRPVRVVARDAVASFERAVDIRLVQPDLFLFVAAEAQRVHVRLEQQFGQNSVPQMAFLALALFRNRVDALQGKIFIGKLFVAAEAILLRERLPRRRGIDRKENREHAKDETSGKKSVSLRVASSSSHRASPFVHSVVTVRFP